MGGATSCFALEESPDSAESPSDECYEDDSANPSEGESGAMGEETHQDEPEEFDREWLGQVEWAGPVDAPKVGLMVPMVESREQVPDDALAWCPVSSAKFNVRQGPDYSSTGAKAPSQPALYECIGVDLYRSRKPVYHMASQLRLPDVSCVRNNLSTSVPSMLFLNVMVPAGSPSMFSQKTNGETVNVLFCFVMKQETADALQNLETAPPSVRLLEKYFRQAREDPLIANRFKLMGSVKNWEQAELPSMLKSFNGKPTLVTKSGEWYYNWKDGQGYAELDCNTAHWCYMARKGLHSAWKNIGLAVFDFGVVVEAREDEEMPEQILACATMCHVRLDSQLQQWQGTCGPTTADPASTIQWKCYDEKKKKSRK